MLLYLRTQGNVILFLEIGGAGMTAADEAFCARFGADRVGWLGRNLKPRQVRDGLPSGRYDVVGGQMTLAMSAALTDVSLVTTLLSDPVRRAVTRWSRALSDPDDPFHAAPHTFTLVEVLEERHPFRAHLCNVATRTLTPKGERLVAQNAVAELARRPALIGHSDRRAPYAHALAEVLGVERNAFDPLAFRPLLTGLPKGPVRDLLASANRQDLRLMKAVAERADESLVWRSNV